MTKSYSSFKTPLPGITPARKPPLILWAGLIASPQYFHSFLRLALAHYSYATVGQLFTYLSILLDCEQFEDRTMVSYLRVPIVNMDWLLCKDYILYSSKNTCVGAEWTWIWVHSLPFTVEVTVGKLISLSLSLCICKTGIIIRAPL